MRQVKSPLLVTRCMLCERRRSCAYIPLMSGFNYPLCRQCIRGLIPKLIAALLEMRAQEQGR